MKVALTGAHGVGKTTLLSRLSQVLEVPNAVCREVPRLIIESASDEHFFRRGNNSPLRQFLILFYQLVEEDTRAREAALVLSDRTLVDHLAYTVALFPDIESTSEYAALMAAVRTWLPQYDLILKVPIEFPVSDDGVREGDVQFQRQIDQRIDALYRQLHVEPIDVRGTVEQRTTRAVQLIRERL
jgi:predicted ATPase